ERLDQCDQDHLERHRRKRHARASGAQVHRGGHHHSHARPHRAPRSHPRSLPLVQGVNKFPGAGTIPPTPAHTVLAACTAPGQPSCLVPCPTCGNGTGEFPETCDGGNAVSCDGCSQFCQIESCDDGNPCTTDQCDAQLGCGPHTQGPNGTPASDGQVCNGEKLCSSGFCSSGGNPPAGTP